MTSDNSIRMHATRMHCDTHFLQPGCLVLIVAKSRGQPGVTWYYDDHVLDSITGLGKVNKSKMQSTSINIYIPLEDNMVPKAAESIYYYR